MTDKFEIACLFGTNMIAYIEINSEKSQFMRKKDSDNILDVKLLDIEARVV